MFTRAKTFQAWFCFVVLCLSLSATVIAADSVAKSAPATNNQLAEAVSHAILMYPQYGIYDWIDGSIKGGVVTLTGAVLQEYRKSDIEQRIRSVAGVKD